MDGPETRARVSRENQVNTPFGSPPDQPLTIEVFAALGTSVPGESAEVVVAAWAVQTDVDVGRLVASRPGAHSVELTSSMGCNLARSRQPAEPAVPDASPSSLRQHFCTAPPG
jgi:hypothetical protein